MNKGGHTKTTWASGSKWRSSATQTIRVPVVLSNEIMEFAKKLDAGIAVSHGNRTEIVLAAIEEYICWRQQNYRSTLSAKLPNIESRTWDELRKFREWVGNQPIPENSAS